jgi:hypothetical protein
VKRWSEIFIDVELRLKWLNDKLKIERDRLMIPPGAAEEIVAEVIGDGVGGLRAVAGIKAE